MHRFIAGPTLATSTRDDSTISSKRKAKPATLQRPSTAGAPSRPPPSSFNAPPSPNPPSSASMRRPATSGGRSYVAPPPRSPGTPTSSSSSASTSGSQRMSLLVTAFGLRNQPANRQGSQRVRGGVLPEEDLPVLDISAANAMEDLGEEEREAQEREALRNEAARSVGLKDGPTLRRQMSSVTQPDIEEEEIYRGMTENSNGSLPGSAESGPPYRMNSEPQPPYRISTTTTKPSTSESLNQSPTQYQTPIGTVPNFPAMFASIQPYAQSSSVLQRHYPSSGNFFSRPKDKDVKKGGQWKNRHVVLTGSKSSPGADTVTHLHLFRTPNSSTSPAVAAERELERLRIDEDSMVCVVDESRPWAIKIGGTHAGGSNVRGNANRVGGGMGVGMGMGAVGVMGSPAMAVSLGGMSDIKVMWTVVCPSAEVMQAWIATIKAALFVQRAEKAGLAMSLMNPPADVKMTGDLDVLLSLRAQGLLQNGQYQSPGPQRRPSTAGSARRPSTAGSTTGSKSFGQPSIISTGTATTSVTATTPATSPTSPTTPVGLKGLFSSGAIANNTLSSAPKTNGIRPRSFSESTSGSGGSPIRERDPIDAPYGSRADALLALTMQRGISEGAQPSSFASSSSVLLDRSIREDYEFVDSPQARRVSSASSLSLAPPPSKRPSSANGKRNGNAFSQEEMMRKAMFAVPLDASTPSIMTTSAADPILEDEREYAGSGTGGSKMATPVGSPGWETRTLSAEDDRPSSTGAMSMDPLDSSSAKSQSESHDRPPESSPSPPVHPSPPAESSPNPNSKRPNTGTRRVPKMLAPPSGPPPSAPLPVAPVHPIGHEADRDRGSNGSSYVNSQRISSSSGLSIRSFTSGGSGSKDSGSQVGTVISAFRAPAPPARSSPSRSEFGLRSNRLTPPSAPPPSVALPAPPEERGQSHRRSTSLTAIPSTPPPMDPPYLSPQILSVKMNRGGSSPGPQGRLLNASSSRLRQLSSPSPRSQPPSQPLPQIPNPPMVPPRSLARPAPEQPQRMLSPPPASHRRGSRQAVVVPGGDGISPSQVPGILDMSLSTSVEKWEPSFRDSAVLLM